MKQILSYTVLAMLLLAACQQISTSSSEGESVTQAPEVTDVYDFPIKPDSPAWIKLQSHDEMIAVCQLPTQTLEEISTQGLVHTVLNYPLLSDMYAFQSVQLGFQSVTNGFNGLQEFLNRSDAAKIIVELYSNLAIEVAATQPMEEQGDYVFRIAHTEIIIAQYVILEQLSQAELKELANVTWQNLEAKKRLPEIYGGLSKESTIFLLARIMQRAEYAPFLQILDTDTGVAYFVNDLVPVQSEQDMNVLQTIIDSASKFVNH